MYIGYTSNLKRRLREHQSGEVKSTSSRRPMKLIYFEATLSKRSAIKRERYFKTGYGRKYLKGRL